MISTHVIIFHTANFCSLHGQMRERRVLSIFKDVLLRTRRAQSLDNVHGDSAQDSGSNGTSLNSDSALLALN